MRQRIFGTAGLTNHSTRKSRPRIISLKVAPLGTVVCTEILEHVETGLAILEPIPNGVFAVISVPDFDSFGHFCLFRTTDEVAARYCALFDSFVATGCACNEGNNHWLMKGVRRGVWFEA